MPLLRYLPPTYIKEHRQKDNQTEPIIEHCNKENNRHKYINYSWSNRKYDIIEQIDY